MKTSPNKRGVDNRKRGPLQRSVPLLPVMLVFVAIVFTVVTALIVTVTGVTRGQLPAGLADTTGTGIATVTEDYSSDATKDSVATTATWNTSAGQLELAVSSGYYETDGVTSGADNVSASSGLSADSAIVMDSTGNPIVAWPDNTPGQFDILVSRWTGTTWTGFAGVNYDNISGNAGGSSAPSITLDAAGQPVVAWSDTTSGNAEILVKHWNGSAWVGYLGAGADNISSTAGISNQPSVAVNALGQPIVAWEDNSSGNYEILLKAWGGASWAGFTAAVDNISSNAGDSKWVSVSFGALGPLVTWSDLTPGNSEVLVSRFSAGSWNGLLAAGFDNISSGVSESSIPTMDVTAAGFPVVAWRDDSPGNYDIFILRWNGSAWVGYAGASADNVSSTASSSYAQSLDLDSSDLPVLAWTDDTPGNAEILVKHRTATAWSGFAGSAADNVSGNTSTSSKPSLAVDGSGYPVVTWYENIPSPTEIFLTRFSAPCDPVAVAQSISVDATGEPITSATLTADAQLNGGSVNYFLTSNGTTFESTTDGAAHVFGAVQSDLRWRAELVRGSGPSACPTINSLSITYTTSPVFAYERISGTDRTLTGIAVNNKRFATADSADGALLCNAANPVDCLAASPLAVQMNAGLLLNSQSGLDSRVGDEIARSTTPDDPIIVLGQTSAQSDAVIAGLNALGYGNIVRLGGGTRIETSSIIAARLRSISPAPIQRIFFASGFKGPVDALVSSSPAGVPTSNGALTAVLLVRDNSVPDAIRAELANYPSATQAYVFGGTAVLTEETFNQIKSLLPAGATLTRAAGSNRYETSTMAAAALFTNPTAIALAAGAAPNGGLAVDALSGGPFAASQQSPIILVQNSALPSVVSTYLDSVKASVDKLWVLGGTAAVTDGVVQAAITALGH